MFGGLFGAVCWGRGSWTVRQEAAEGDGMGQRDQGHLLFRAEQGLASSAPTTRLSQLPPVERNQLTLDLTIDLTRKEPQLVLEPSRRPHSSFGMAPRWKPAFKRLLDIVGSLVALVLASPVMLGAGLAIALTSRGPVFFTQERVGYMGRPFRFLKFRSMCHDAVALREDLEEQNQHGDAPVFKVREDPRMTSVGKVIRRFSIDELPQLFHVLAGKMSLVGPRPLPLQDVVQHVPREHLVDTRMYSTPDLWRLTAKPGITCIWQVSGRSELDYDTWMRMDMEYIENWSLWLDIKLLLRTIPAVLSGRGAY